MSNETHDVLVARWEGFKRLAKTLPNRQVLAVELIRTLDDQTVAVFTTVRDGKPIRTVVKANAHGKIKSNSDDHCQTTNKAAVAMEARSVPEEDPAAIALGNPPPKETGTPGIIAVAGSLLGTAFDVGELVDLAGK